MLIKAFRKNSSDKNVPLSANVTPLIEFSRANGGSRTENSHATSMDNEKPNNNEARMVEERDQIEIEGDRRF